MFNSFPHSSASSFVSFVLFCDDWIFGLMDFLDVGLILLLPLPTKGSRLNDALITFAACVDTLLRSRATVISLSVSLSRSLSRSHSLIHPKAHALSLSHTQTLSLCNTSTHHTHSHSLFHSVYNWKKLISMGCVVAPAVVHLWLNLHPPIY